MINQINCPICASNNLEFFLSRKNVPVCQNILFSDQDAAISINKGDLELAVCSNCGFIFNSSFQADKLLYGDNYENSQIHSHYFENYVDGLVSYLINERGLYNKNIIEVGCGNGYFLRKLVGAKGAKNKGYGFDPSYEGPEVDLDGRLHFKKSILNPRDCGITADAVICRHVIEHLHDPVQLLCSIQQILNNTGTNQIFIETPCAEWILKNQVMWDFFYEHCSYFSVDSLMVAMERSGLKILNIQHIFGEQYLGLVATSGDNPEKSRPNHIDEILMLCRRLGQQENDLVKHWRTSIEKLRENGPVALWGAGAKGVTLANLVDPDIELIACVVDLNPQKQGKFLSGTGHPIINYLDLPLFQIKNAVQMNPNYAVENLALLHNAKLEVRLIDPTKWSII